MELSPIAILAQLTASHVDENVDEMWRRVARDAPNSYRLLKSIIDPQTDDDRYMVQWFSDKPLQVLYRFVQLAASPNP